MSRVYEYNCKNGIKVGLYKRINCCDLSYVITRNNRIICEAEYFGDANREYHQTIRKEEVIYA